MHQQRQTNLHSQPTNGAGNQIEHRRDVVPQTMGSSQPTPRVGNLNGRTRDVVPDTMAYSQPTPRVGNLNGRRRNVVPDTMASSQTAPRVGNLNMNGRRRDVVPDPIGSGSGMQADESGRSQALLTHQPSHRNQSPGLGETGVLARPPKQPRRTSIQTRANIEPEAEPNRQGHLETVHLSDDSSDEYQNPCNADETGSETEIDVDTSDISEGTTSGRRHRWQASHRQGKGQRPMVRISTTSRSQEVPLVGRTPANRGRIIRGRAYSPLTFLLSSMGYSSPLATHSGTTSGVRSSSPVGEPGIPQPGRPRLATDSRRNTVTGAEGTILEQAMALMLWYTLFDNPLPNPVALTSQIYTVWGKALETISDAGNIEPSEESVKQVS